MPTCYCFYRLWRSAIPAFAIYSGEYGIQYCTPKFGEDVICPCCFTDINFSRFLSPFYDTLPFPSKFSLSFVLVPLCCTPDQRNFFTTNAESCWFSIVVPISIYILSLPLPYIPHGAELSMSFIIGAAVLLMGLILYNFPQSSSKQSKADWKLKWNASRMTGYRKFTDWKFLWNGLPLNYTTM